MFYSMLKSLCKQRGTSITAMAKALNLSTNSATRWKAGQTPNVATMKRIADYLSVSVDYLLSDGEDIRKRPLTDDEVMLLKLFEKLDSKDRSRFIGRLEEFVRSCGSKAK